MKKRLILVGVIFIAVAIWLVQQPAKQAQDRIRSTSAATAGQPSSTEKTAPAVSRSSLVQPVAPVPSAYPRWEGGRSTTLNDPRWEIYKQRQKGDRAWQWKMPIEFYGKVVDENNQPVSAATATFIRSDLSNAGTTESKTQSDANGRFLLQDVTGKGMSVSVEKAGYYSSKSDSFDFEYALFSDTNFYQPDSSNPVVFHLRKKGEAEPLIFRQTLYGLKLDGTPQYLDLVTGKKATGGSPVGDIIISLNRGPFNDQNKFDWTLTLQGVGAAGLVESHDEFMFEAPDSGYKNAVQIQEQAGASDYQSQVTASYYVRLSDGKTYARIEAEIRPKYNNQGAVDLKLYLNPSGSRNLEYDPAKAIKVDHR